MPTMPQPTGSVLRVPEIPEDYDVLRAALLYAEHGWYVIAVDPMTKRPASFYGNGWPHMSSRDPQEIVSWFAGTPYMLGLHCGRSGALAFDIDDYELTPELLLRAFNEEKPPTQLTRSEGERGHRLFRIPEGRRLGNSRGELGRETKAWGEVRGMNGIIVVEPSHHSKFEEGGRYKWRETGVVPMLPSYVDELLPDASDPQEPATDAVVAKFIEENSNGHIRPQAMKAVLKKFSEALNPADGGKRGSRHDACVDHLCWAMRECRMGLYQADLVIPTMESMFVAAMGTDRHPRSEFRGILAFAVAQALSADIDQRRNEAIERLNATAVMKIAGVGIQPAPKRPASRPRTPEDYFHDKGAGIDIEMLASDVVNIGDLSIGPGGTVWKFDHGVWLSADDEIEIRCVMLLGPRYRDSYVRSATSVVKTMIGRIRIDPVHEFMNFANGMLEWRTGILHAHSPHLGSTVQFPVEWDADAKCPKFDKFMESILTPDYVTFAWQMIGYLMYSGNPKQKAFLLLGTGRNGKGTLLRVVEQLLGVENCAAESLDSLNTNRFAPISLFGKIANIAGDIDATYQTSTAAFKKLTGEDTYAGERKYGDRFLFQSWAVPVFSANKIPGSADTSHGYLARWLIIEFHRRFSDSEQVQGLSDKLLDELPGIAVKAVNALREVLDGSGFKADGDIERGKSNFASTIDQVRQWFEECCSLVDNHRESRTHVYNSYKLWAQQQSNTPVRATEFWSRMEEIGYKWMKTGGERIFKGFQVLEMRAFETASVDSGSNSDLPDAFD